MTRIRIDITITPGGEAVTVTAPPDPNQMGFELVEPPPSKSRFAEEEEYYAEYDGYYGDVPVYPDDFEDTVDGWTRAE